MNIIDAVSICILVLFVLFGIYKGFISTLLNIGAYFISVALSFLLKPLGASAIKHSDRIFNMMLYYTEGSELIANPEDVRMGNILPLYGRDKRHNRLLQSALSHGQGDSQKHRPGGLRGSGHSDAGGLKRPTRP